MRPTKSVIRAILQMVMAVVAALMCAALAVAQSAETVIHSFVGTDGAYPVGNLVSDAAGNLYGATYTGGLQNTTGCNPDSPGFQSYCGTIFKLSKTSGGAWTATILHEFTGGADGGNPAAGLVFDAAGNLYGTAQFGGNCTSAFGCGVVFELSPTQSGPWTETVLYSFHNGNDGGLPASQLVFDALGNLYGSTINGGTGSCGLGVPCGVVFELSPGSSGWTESVIYNFQGFSDGAEPTGPLVFDAKGNLYGTTSIGGGFNQNCGYPFFGCGSVFELSPSSAGGWTKSTPYIFNAGHGGAYPADGIMIDKSGTVYGTATAGGSSQYCGAAVPGCGVVYALNPNSALGWNESVAFAFPHGAGGQNPHGGLTMDAAGNLYGTAYGGVSSTGGAGAGIVFKLSQSSGNSWSETVLYTFPRSGSKGAAPASSLIRDAAGNLYGTTASGGSVNDTYCNLTCGVVYKITP